MDDVVDSLKIEVEGDSSSAIDGIKKLVTTLEGIKSVTSISNKTLNQISKSIDKLGKSVDGINSGSVSKLKELTDAISKMSEFSNINIPAKLANRIVDIGTAVDCLKGVDFSQLTEMANGLAALSNVGNMGNISIPHYDNTSAPVEPAATSPSGDSDLNGSVEIQESAVSATDAVANLSNALNSNRSLWTDIASVSSRAFTPIKNIVQSTVTAVNAKFDSIKPKIAAVALAGTIQFNILKMKAQDAVSAIGSKFNAIKEKVAPVFSYIGNTFTQPVAKIKQAISTIPPHFEKVRAVASSVFSKIGQVAQSAFSGISSAATKTAGALKKIGSTAGKVGSVMKTAFMKTAFRPLDKFKNAVKDGTSKLGGFLKSLKRIALYRAIRGLLSAITQGFKEGMGNCYQYSKAIGGSLASSLDKISTSFLYFKNAIGAAVAPLINMLAPAIEFIIDKAVALINVLNQLFAKLSGASTWTKAVKYPKEYAEAADTASAANKELQKSILGIDELNVMNDNSSSSGGGGASGTDYSSMFTEESVGDVASPLGDVFQVFKDAWDTKGQGVIDSIKSAFENIKGLLSSVGDSFREVWTNGTGQEMVEHILGIFQGIVDCVGNLAGSLKKAWDEAGNGTKIVQGVADIFNDILEFSERLWKATADWLGSLDLSPLMGAVAGAIAAFEPLVDLIGNTLAWLYETVLLPIATWAIEEAAPASIDAITAAFDMLVAILTPVFEGIQLLWDKLQPVVEWIESVVIVVIDGLRSIFEKVGKVFEEKGTKIQEIFAGIGDIVQAVWVVVEPIFNLLKDVVGNVFGFIGDIVSTVIGFVIDLFGGLIDFVAGVFTGDWDRAWKGIKDIFVGIWDLIKGVALAIWDFLKGIWNSIKNNVESIWNGIKTFLSNLWDGIKGCAVSIWNGLSSAVMSVVNGIKNGITTAFTAVKNFVSSCFNTIKTVATNVWNGIWGAIKGVINGILGGIEGMVNGVIKGLNFMINALNKLSFDVPDWVPLIGGKKFGFNIKNISEVNLPRLADGGMVNAGQMFIAREAGPEMVGNIGNRTAVMNNDQIVESVSQGVCDANSEQNALLREEISILRKLLDKDTNVTAYVGTGSVISGLERKNRRDGRTIVPVGV